MTKPITLYSHASGPNPWKVSILCEELDIPYETKFMDMPDLKKSPFVDLNPNGRVPAIEDPNTGMVVWESGAIIEYLIDKYDTEHKLSYGDKEPEKYQLKQWLYFQVSGQGPYFGQKAWFAFFHSEKNLTSVLDRYTNEIKRVVGVLDSQLKTTGTGWLVGDKCTYADLSFIMWDTFVDGLLGAEAAEVKSSNPNFTKWHEALISRPAVAKVLKDREAAGKH